LVIRKLVIVWTLGYCFLVITFKLKLIRLNYYFELCIFN